jgi:hypothetical protein
MLVLALGTGALETMVAQLRCIDAARAAARFAARGEPRDVAVAEGRRVGPAGSQVDVTPSGDDVEVRVRALVPIPFGAAIPVAATVAAPREEP